MDADCSISDTSKMLRIFLARPQGAFRALADAHHFPDADLEYAV